MKLKRLKRLIELRIILLFCAIATMLLLFYVFVFRKRGKETEMFLMQSLESNNQPQWSFIKNVNAKCV